MNGPGWQRPPSRHPNPVIAGLRDARRGRRGYALIRLCNGLWLFGHVIGMMDGKVLFQEVGEPHGAYYRYVEIENVLPVRTPIARAARDQVRASLGPEFPPYPVPAATCSACQGALTPEEAKLSQLFARGRDLCRECLTADLERADAGAT